jgi:integrase
VLRAAIVVMARAGLRVGALPSLSITGSRWTATTKGKEQGGTIPETVRKAIERAGLPLRAPFAELTATRILDRVRYLVRKLLAEGKLRARYSLHDLRHAFAVRLYQDTHDVYQVEQALGHASVGVTEQYLRSIGQQRSP